MLKESFRLVCFFTHFYPSPKKKHQGCSEKGA